MPDIVHDLFIDAPADRVFEAISQPEGLARWWTHAANGRPVAGAEYRLDFGPGSEWRAVVSRSTPPGRFELRFTAADPDWLDTIVAFHVLPGPRRTTLRFEHRGWPESSEHYRISCFCWAMYLRMLRRYLEHGETVPYADRLDV